MNKQPRKPTSRDSRRCHHRFANATRCRMPALAPGRNYCPLHADLIENESGADAAEELMKGIEVMNSADHVRVVLSRLIELVAENRITPRRASIISLICGQVLRSLASLEAEVQAFHARGESWDPDFGLVDLVPEKTEAAAAKANVASGTAAANTEPAPGNTDAAPAPAAPKRPRTQLMPLNGRFLGIPLALPPDPNERSGEAAKNTPDKAETEAETETEDEPEPVSSS
jgi:hypothetical protein